MMEFIANNFEWIFIGFGALIVGWASTYFFGGHTPKKTKKKSSREDHNSNEMLFELDFPEEDKPKMSLKDKYNF